MEHGVFIGCRPYSFTDAKSVTFTGFTVCIGVPIEESNGFFPVFVYDNFNRKQKLPSVSSSSEIANIIGNFHFGDKILFTLDRFGKLVDIKLD